jgi:hypothetical protein
MADTTKTTWFCLFETQKWKKKSNNTLVIWLEKWQINFEQLVLFILKVTMRKVTALNIWL